MIDKISMSLYEVLYLSVTFAGFMALGAQLLFQGRQLRILLKTLDAAGNASVGQRQLDVDSLFVEKPHLVDYFLSDKMPVKEDENEPPQWQCYC